MDPNAFLEAKSLERRGTVTQVFEFLIQNKRWWLMPTVAVLLILGVLMLLGGGAAAPFVYSFF